MKRMRLYDCLCYLIGRSFRNMLSCYIPFVRKYDLTVSQLFILLALYENDGVSAQELSSKLALGASTLTGILDRLERKGLIKRQINMNDRRSIIVSLTEKGKGLKDELWKIYEKVNGELRSALSQKEIEDLYRIMEKLYEKANRMQNK